MKSYYRVMLGRNSEYAKDCFAGNFIGADFGIVQDLTDKLPEEKREFQQVFIPLYLARPHRTHRTGLKQMSGFMWTVVKGISRGDIVLCPDGSGNYWAGEVTGDYTYEHGGVLPHRRTVRWLPQVIRRDDMSEGLQGSAGSPGTAVNISKHADELEKLILGTLTA